MAGLITVFIKGLVIGLIIAVPVGPVGVLCLQRTIHHGRLTGLLSGLGAATADALFGAVAAFGLTLITDFIELHRFWIQLIGGIIIAGIGVQLFFSSSRKTVKEVPVRNPAGAFVSILMLTLTNPLTIITFALLFAGTGLIGREMTPVHSIVTVGGVFSGSMVWWVILVLAGNIIRRRIASGNQKRLNAVSGAVIFIFGLVMIAGDLVSAASEQIIH